MKSKLRKALALALSCLMACALVPAIARADAQDGGATYDAKDMVYDNNHVLQSVKFGPYTLTNHQNDWLGGESDLTIDNLETVADHLSKDWAPIAGAIWSATDNRITTDSPDDSYAWNNIFGPGVTNGEEGACVDVIDALRGRTKPNDKDGDDNADSPTDAYNRDAKWYDRTTGNTYMTSGIQYATSLDAILREMCNMTVTAFNARKTEDDTTTIENQQMANDIYEKADGLEWMKNTDANSTDTRAVYRIVTSVNGLDTILERQYANNYALIFYDFVLTPVTADNVETTEPSVTYTPDDSANQQRTSYFENRSQADSSASVQVSTSMQETLSNTFQTSKTITHGGNVGFSWTTTLGTKDTFWQNSFTLSASYSWSEAVATAYSEQSSLSTSIASNSSSTVALPAHTAIALEQTSGKVTKTATYKCPMALNYKVAVVSLGTRDYKDDIDYAKTFSTRFGCGVMEGGVHATQNLYQRAVSSTYRNKLERSYGQVDGRYKHKSTDISVSTINWDAVAGKYENEYQTSAHITNAATQIPMFSSGATMTVNSESKITRLGSIVPIYDLAQIKLVQGNKRYNMTVGDSMSLGSLVVNGYDSDNVDFYGFDPEKGEWVLCDDKGNELTTSPVAQIDRDAATGSDELNATGKGTVYLKWMLADDVCYKANEGIASGVTRDTEGLVYPMVRVNVSEVPADATGYNVKAEGEASVLVNDTISLPNTFKAAVYNPDDIVVSHAVRYEAQDQAEGSAVTIDENGTFKATEPGDHLVRAMYALSDNTTIKSPWLTVHVADLPTVTVDPAELTPEGGEATVTLRGECLRDGIKVVCAIDDANAGDAKYVTAKTTGSDTEQVATVTLPANAVFGHDDVYAVSYTITGKDVTTNQTVTVKANTLTAHDAVDATCTEDGNIAYWECDQTGVLYKDIGGSEEVWAEDTVIKALGHDLKHTDAVEPTCLVEGSLEHWTCDRCKAVFADAQGEEQLTTGDVTVPATGHKLEYVAAVVPTCDEDGNIEHWHCTKCDKRYADDEGRTVLADDEVAVRAIGHDWAAWTPTVEATDEAEGEETRTCKNDPTHVETRSIPITTHVHDLRQVEGTAATCTQDGVKEHWVCEGCGRFFVEGAESQKVEVNVEDTVIKALGHAWNEGERAAEPTCATDGQITYTCTRDNCDANKTKPIDATGHDWNEGAVTTEPTCTAKGVMTYTCTRDPSHTRTASIDQKGHAWDGGAVTSQPTCTTQGQRLFVCNNDPTHTRTEAIRPTGHAWGDPTYTWSADYKTVTARHVCKTNRSHVETAMATVTSTVTQKPTATQSGVLTHTATFAVPWAITQTRMTNIDPTGVPDPVATVSAVCHVQRVGWLNAISGGNIIGTVGRKNRLEAFELELKDVPVAGGIQYRSHVQGKGWEKKWSHDGSMSGTSGKKKRIEAVQIRLTGQMAEQYDVYYRVHAQKYGWMAWAKNGAKAGTQGKRLRVEAMQIVLVRKGDRVPSSVHNNIAQSYSNAFVKKKK